MVLAQKLFDNKPPLDFTSFQYALIQTLFMSFCLKVDIRWYLPLIYFFYVMIFFSFENPPELHENQTKITM